MTTENDYNLNREHWEDISPDPSYGIYDEQGLQTYTIKTPVGQNQEVYDFLVNDLSGANTSLSGSQVCVDSHPQLARTLSFKLSGHQVTELLNQFPEVNATVEDESGVDLFDFTLEEISHDRFPTFAGRHMEAITLSTYPNSLNTFEVIVTAPGFSTQYEGIFQQRILDSNAEGIRKISDFRVVDDNLHMNIAFKYLDVGIQSWQNASLETPGLPYAPVQTYPAHQNANRTNIIRVKSTVPSDEDQTQLHVPQLAIFEDRDFAYTDETTFALQPDGVVEFTYFVPSDSNLVGKYWHLGTSYASTLPDNAPAFFTAEQREQGNWGKLYAFTYRGHQIVGGEWTTARLEYGESRGGRDVSHGEEFRNSPTKTNRFIFPASSETISNAHMAAAAGPVGIKTSVDHIYYISEYKIFGRLGIESLFRTKGATWDYIGPLPEFNVGTKFQIGPRNPNKPDVGNGPEFYEWVYTYGDTTPGYSENNCRWPWESTYTRTIRNGNYGFDITGINLDELNSGPADGSTSQGVIRGTNLVSHHVYHTQINNVDKHDNPINQVYSTTKNLSSIDCSNVDIIVADTSIDKTHTDVSDAVVEFDWTQLRTGPDGVTSGTQILASMGSLYYEDTNGHGTACAGLIAGKQSGMARGAKLYALSLPFTSNPNSPLESNNFVQGFQLMVAFQRAKNNNLLGLDSSRPTIISNSWGGSYSRAVFPSSVVKNYMPNLTAGQLTNWGKGEVNRDQVGRSRTVVNTSYAEYVNELTYLGAHVLASAGNANNCIDSRDIAEVGYDGTNSGAGSIPLNKVSEQLFKATRQSDGSAIYGNLLYTEELFNNYDNISNNLSLENWKYQNDPTVSTTTEPEDRLVGSTPQTRPYVASSSTFTLTSIVGTEKHFTPLLFSGTSVDVTPALRYYHEHKDELADLDYEISLSCFEPYSDKINDMDSIVVGDITPLNNPYGAKNIEDSSTTRSLYYSPYSAGYNGPLSWTGFLSGVKTNSDYFPLCSFSQYNEVSGASYIKTAYSTHGPSVDVWAPGNGTIAPHSNYRAFASTPGYSSEYRSDFYYANGGDPNGFRYFAGTSAACPVAAACLATFLAVHPTATPKEAKQWLIDASAKGNILETMGTEYFDTEGVTNTGVVTGRGLFDNVLDIDGGKKHAWHITSPFRIDDNTASFISDNRAITTQGLTGIKGGLYYFSYPGSLNQTVQGETYRDGFSNNWTPEKRKLMAVQQAHGFYRCNNRVVQVYPQRQIIKNFGVDGAPTVLESLSANYVLSADEPIEYRNIYPGSDNSVYDEIESGPLDAS